MAYEIIKTFTFYAIWNDEIYSNISESGNIIN